MQIGMITGEYPPMVGGVGAYTQILAAEMARSGHGVNVFTRRIAEQVASDNAITVSHEVIGKWDWSTTNKITKWVVNSKSEIVFIQFQTAAFDMHPSIHWIPASLRRISIPTIVTFHDLRVPYLFPKAGPARNWIVRKLAHDATGVICTDMEDFDKLSRDKSIRHLRRIPIGTNIAPSFDLANRTRIRQQFSMSNGQLLIGYFGLVNRSKGIGDLFQALKLLVEQGIDAHLLMIGGNENELDPKTSLYRSELQGLIIHMELEGRIKWTGFVPESEASELLYSCDMVALPFVEGVSLRSGTLMAAMSHGKAIVTTSPSIEIPELSGVVEYARSADASDLAKKMMAIWRDERRRKALERAALLASQQNFTWQEIAFRNVEFCEEILTVELD